MGGSNKDGWSGRDDDAKQASERDPGTVAPKMSYKRPVYASQVDPPELEQAIMKLHAAMSQFGARQRRIMIGVIARDLYGAAHAKGYGDGMLALLEYDKKAPLKERAWDAPSDTEWNKSSDLGDALDELFETPK